MAYAYFSQEDSWIFELELCFCRKVRVTPIRVISTPSQVFRDGVQLWNDRRWIFRPAFALSICNPVPRQPKVLDRQNHLATIFLNCPLNLYSRIWNGKTTPYIDFHLSFIHRIFYWYLGMNLRLSILFRNDIALHAQYEYYYRSSFKCNKMYVFQ